MTIVKRKYLFLTLTIFFVFIVLYFVVAPKFYKGENSRYYNNKNQIIYIMRAIDQYKLDTGGYPDNENGLKLLLQENNGKKNYIKNIPNDPWGRPYHYLYPGKKNSSFYDLWSYGGDGLPGGKGEFRDANNWGEK